jgi:hypothetical protein
LIVIDLETKFFCCAMKDPSSSFRSRAKSVGLMILLGMVFVSLLGNIGKADASFWWTSTSTETIGRIEEVEKSNHVVSSNERRILQPVKWLSRAGGGEEEDESCNWDRLGIDAASCERYETTQVCLFGGTTVGVSLCDVMLSHPN